MAKTGYHWCPSGCGKRVKCVARNRWIIAKYKCDKCKKTFVKEKLGKMQRLTPYEP